MIGPATIAAGDTDVLGQRSAALHELRVLTAANPIWTEPAFEADEAAQLFA
jgi:hypothetical protein